MTLVYIIAILVVFSLFYMKKIFANAITFIGLFVIAWLTLFSTEDVYASEKKQSYFEDSKRGYWWYEKPAEIEEEIVEEKKETPKSSPQTISPKTPLQQLKAMGKQWENDMAMAIKNPTRENMRNWMEIHTKVMQQADDFSGQFQKTIWSTPKYDYRLQKPVDREAIIANNFETVKDADKSLDKIANEKGLLFFFRSDCPYCKKFSPVLKKFSEKYGFSIVPISLDGPGIPDFPYPKRPSSITQHIEVPVVPALFMVDPSENSVAPVSYGFADWTTLIRKVVYAGTEMNVRRVAAVKEGNQ